MKLLNAFQFELKCIAFLTHCMRFFQIMAFKCHSMPTFLLGHLFNP